MHPVLIRNNTPVLSPSQLVTHVAGAPEVLHGHDLDHQAGPAGEVLRALALARLGVVLLPGEPRVDPALVDGLDEVLAQAAVEVRGPGLVWTVLLCYVLRGVILCQYNHHTAGTRSA